MARTDAPRSSTRLSRAEIAAQYEQWLKLVPWQWFVTLTFAYQVSDQQANQIFLEYINRVERQLRAPIIYVRGDEKRYSGCGKPGAPRHYHLVMASSGTLNPRWMCERWEAIAGKRQNGAGADFRPYDPRLDGVAYVLKAIDQDGGDWVPGNLDLMLPTSELRDGKYPPAEPGALDCEPLEAAVWGR
jgi:hypothetical protein